MASAFCPILHQELYSKHILKAFYMAWCNHKALLPSSGIYCVVHIKVVADLPFKKIVFTQIAFQNTHTFSKTVSKFAIISQVTNLFASIL